MSLTQTDPDSLAQQVQLLFIVHSGTNQAEDTDDYKNGNNVAMATFSSSEFSVTPFNN